MSAPAPTREQIDTYVSLASRLKLSLDGASARAPNDDYGLVAEGEAYLRDWARRERELIDQATEAERALSYDAWWDDKGRPDREGVARTLQELMGAFPTEKVPNPRVFARFLIEDVQHASPAYEALHLACRKIRATFKFMPAIAEVLAILKEQSAKTCELFEAVDAARSWLDEADRLGAQPEPLRQLITVASAVEDEF